MEERHSEKEPQMPAGFFDTKFRHQRKQYLVQCLMATVTILIILFILDSVLQTVLIASLAASTFIAFAMPHTQRSKPRCLIGGYIVGASIGCALSLLATLLSAASLGNLHTLQIFCGALATGLAIFVMVTTDTEHPPAAALALGFVLNEWDVLTLAVVMAGISMITLIKEITKPRLIDLL
jgi:CBS-domain-containing membrane protein